MDGDVLLDGKSIGSYGSRELAKKVAILPQNPTAPGEITVDVYKRQDQYNWPITTSYEIHRKAIMVENEKGRYTPLEINY